MSRMSEMIIEIEEMLWNGYTAEEIAKTLNVPIEWVNDTEKRMFSEPEYDPFLSDAEADADALASAGWGTDEDYVMENDYFDGEF